jgi:hypothetical protein
LQLSMVSTRSHTRERAHALAASVLASSDIQSLLLPRLDFQTFVALRSASKEICSAMQLVCEDLILVLKRASALYVSPRFAEGLALVSEHHQPICWLIQTPVLAVVAAERQDELIGTAYHLLQAHLSRLQKLSISIALRRASARPRLRVAEASRFTLMHLGVRLGMFTESSLTLNRLLEAAKAAVDGLSALHRRSQQQPPATAAAHYTLAGFYTYHHKREQLPHALKLALSHLDSALRIQMRKLGATHVSTLCSQLVKAQVMLLQNNISGCGDLLTEQLKLCEHTLSPTHPLAAKMLAVMARLHHRQGRMCECEQLQQRVLSMRHEVLGLHHEDTHRSAVDVYQRLRSQVLSHGQVYLVEWAPAMEVCLRMLHHAASDARGMHGFALSKSLQSMGEMLFGDLRILAMQGVWPREQTVDFLALAADTAAKLPPLPLTQHLAAVDDAAAAIAAGEPIPAPGSSSNGVHAAAAHDDADEVGGATGEATETEEGAMTAAEAEVAELEASNLNLREIGRRLLVENLRLLRQQLLLEPNWPPQRRPFAATAPGATAAQGL